MVAVDSSVDSRTYLSPQKYNIVILFANIFVN